MAYHKFSKIKLQWILRKKLQVQLHLTTLDLQAMQRAQLKAITVEFQFLKPSFFRTSGQLKPKVVSPPQSNTLILPPISQTIQFCKPIFISLGGSKNWDSTVLRFYMYVSRFNQWLVTCKSVIIQDVCLLADLQSAGAQEFYWFKSGNCLHSLWSGRQQKYRGACN